MTPQFPLAIALPDERHIFAQPDAFFAAGPGVHGEYVMRNAIDCRHEALECLRMAEQAKARQHKALMVTLAQAWAQLAEQTEQRGPAIAGDAPAPTVN